MTTGHHWIENGFLCIDTDIILMQSFDSKMDKMNFNINVIVLVLVSIFTSVACDLKVHHQSKLSVNAFRYLWDVPIYRCSDECLARTKCKSFNYVERLRFCELNAVDSTAGNLMAAPGYTFMDKSAMDKSARNVLCKPECKETEVCELKGGAARCVINECPDPPSIQWASVQGNLRHIGARILYICDVGYVVDTALKSPMTSSTCLAAGTWSEFNIACATNSPCGPLSEPVNGKLAYSNLKENAVSVGSKATYTCDTGYTISPESSRLLNDAVSRTCGDDNQWTETPATCLLIDCGNPTSAINGHNTTAIVTTYLSVVKFVCDTGYQYSSGNYMRKCTAAGTWDREKLVCEQIVCRNPGSVTNGHNTTAIATTYLSVVTFECNTGYKASSGTTSRKCTSGGTWTGDRLVCTRIVPFDPCRGTDNTNCGYTNGKCENNVCGCTDGTFKETATDCVAKFPTDPCTGTDNTDCGYINGKCDSNTKTCGCDVAFKVSENACVAKVPTDPCTGTDNTDCGYINGKCDSNTKTCGCDVAFKVSENTCVAKVPTDPCTGTDNTDCGYINGKCDSNTKTCGCDVAFKVSENTCVAKVPTDPCTGTDNTDCGYINGKCDSNTKTCGCDVAFKVSRDTCVAKVPTDLCTGTDNTDCGYINGKCDSNTKTCGCDVAFKVSENTCVAKVPTDPCTGTDNTDCGYINGKCDSSTKTCGCDVAFKVSGNACVAKDCGSPSPAINGKYARRFNTTYHSKVDYECNAGYVRMDGSETRECMEDERWSGEPLNCTGVVCETPKPAVYGHQTNGTSTTYRYPDEVTFACNTGYKFLSGHYTRKCTAEGVWDGDALMCTVIDCGTPQSPINGNVTDVPSTTYSSQATFECLPGYERASGNLTRNCTARGSWDGEILTCVAVTTACQSGWDKIEQSCYYSGDTKASFDESQKVCAAFGSHQVFIETELELSNLTPSIVEKVTKRPDCMYTGHFYNSTAMKWQYYGTDKFVYIIFSLFIPDMDDAHSDSYAIIVPSNISWSLNDGSSACYYLCEKELSTGQSKGSTPPPPPV